MARATTQIPDELGDDRVRLRPLRRDDIDAWVGAFASDPQLGVMLGTDADPLPGDLRRRLKRWSDRPKAGLGAEYVIADPATDRLLGAVNLFGLDWRHGRGELGIWLAGEARGRGVAHAALSLLLDVMFAHLGLQRAELTTTPANAPVLALAARLGFRREGLLRERDVQRGRRVDVVVLGLLRAEWRDGAPGRGGHDVAPARD